MFNFEDKVSELNLVNDSTKDLISRRDTLREALHNETRRYSYFVDLLYDIRDIERELRLRGIDY